MRVISVDLILGENSDKPNDSGKSTVIEARGFVPMIPDGDMNGGLMVAPGWRIYGQDTFASVPGLHGEPGTFESISDAGFPSATASESSFYRGVRIAGATPPGFGGTMVMAIYCGTGANDPRAGEALGVYHELWGNDVRAGEKVGELDEPAATSGSDASIATMILLGADAWWPLQDDDSLDLYASSDLANETSSAVVLESGFESSDAVTFESDSISSYTTFSSYDDAGGSTSYRPWLSDGGS